MSRKGTHTQCALRHDDGGIDTSWLPSRYAVVGKRLRLHDEEGWEVTAVYATKPTEQAIVDSHGHTKQRQRSDA